MCADLQQLLNFCKEAGPGAYHYYHYTIVCVKTATMIWKVGE